MSNVTQLLQGETRHKGSIETICFSEKMERGMHALHFEHDGFCRGCVLGKNIKKSFPNSNTRSKGILDLIHSDICGPMSTTSLNGCL
jgi:hypothetical protein